MSLLSYYFTERKRQILWLIHDEPRLTHELIAERLGIAKATLEQHFKFMYRDLADYGIGDQQSLIVELFKAGWFIEANRPGYKPAQSALIEGNRRNHSVK